MSSKRGSLDGGGDTAQTGEMRRARGRRRTAITPICPLTATRAAAVDSMVIPLFDGKSFANWRMSGRGTFSVIDGALQSVPASTSACSGAQFQCRENYVLELDFFIRTFQTNSGIFVRFRRSGRRTCPGRHSVFQPEQWSAVFSGFEIQIDNSEAGQPTLGMAIHRTGAVGCCQLFRKPERNPDSPRPRQATS